VLPGLGQLAAAHGLEGGSQLAAGPHRVEDADRLVEPAEGDERRGAGVLDGGDVGAEGNGLLDEGERGVRITAGFEGDARAVVEPGDAFGGIKRAAA